MATQPKKPNVADIQARKTLIAEIREMATALSDVAEGQDATDHLSDAQVWAFKVEDHPEWAQALLDAEPQHHDAGTGEGGQETPLPIGASHPMKSRAIDAARMLAADPQVQAHMKSLANAKDTVSIGALVFLDDWVRVYGGGNPEKAFAFVNGSKDHLGMPHSGTSATPRTVNGVVIPGSNNPDRFQISYTKDDGTSGSRNTTYFAELFDPTPYGMEIRDILNRIDSCKLGNGNPDPEFNGELWDARSRKQHRDRVNGWRNTCVTNMRKCRRIFDQIAKVAAASNDTLAVRIARKIDPKTGKRGMELLNTPRPLTVGNADDMDHAETFSITSFLSFKPELLKEKTLAGLKATVKRKGKTPAAGKTLDITALPANEVAHGQAVLMTHAFDNPEWEGHWAKRMRGAGSDAEQVTWFDLYTNLHYWYGPKGEFTKRAGAASNAVQQKNNADKAAAA